MLRGITCLLQEKSPFSDDARKQMKRERSRFGGNAVKATSKRGRLRSRIALKHKAREIRLPKAL